MHIQFHKACKKGEFRAERQYIANWLITIPYKPSPLLIISLWSLQRSPHLRTFSTPDTLLPQGLCTALFYLKCSSPRYSDDLPFTFKSLLKCCPLSDGIPGHPNTTFPLLCFTLLHNIYWHMLQYIFFTYLPCLFLVSSPENDHHENRFFFVHCILST